MELKDITKWDDFQLFIDAAYLPMIMNGIQPVQAISDTITFEKIQDALFEAFSPNEKPNRDAFALELTFPNAGTIQLNKGVKFNEPYFFFVNKIVNDLDVSG